MAIQEALPKYDVAYQYEPTPADFQPPDPTRGLILDDSEELRNAQDLISDALLCPPGKYSEQAIQEARALVAVYLERFWRSPNGQAFRLHLEQTSRPILPPHAGPISK